MLYRPVTNRHLKSPQESVQVDENECEQGESDSLVLQVRLCGFTAFRGLWSPIGP